MEPNQPNNELAAVVAEVFEKISSVRLLRGRQIPDIALYMEQVTVFLDEQTDPFLKTDQTVLTKTMINNYTKAGILPRPIKKKYSKQHIMRLNEIFLLKQVYSVAQIGDFYNQLADSTDHVYDIFFELAKTFREDYVRQSVERIRIVSEELAARNVENPTASVYIYALLTALESSVNRKVCVELMKKLKE